MTKITRVFFGVSVALLVFGSSAVAQLQSNVNLTGNQYELDHSISLQDWEYNYNQSLLEVNSGKRVLVRQDEDDDGSKSTSSLTVGYIADEYDLQMDNGSYKYRYDGELSALMISSNASSFTLSYGVTDAEEDPGDIRSIAADLQVGGNVSIFDNLFSLPLKAYIPIRFNFGYRNLALLENEDDKVNMGSGALGAGLGAQVRIPTGLPWLEDNLTAFASLVRSVGGMGDLSSSVDQQDFEIQPDDAAINGIRLTRNTDFNIEGKFERLLGGNIGVTVGMTLRWKSWMDQEAESFGQLFDVASGNQEGVELRATQSLLRIGINW